MSTAARKGKVIVFGLMFWYPLAGVTWQFLHYLVGLRRLGYDTYYVEDSARYVYNPWLVDFTPDARPNVDMVGRRLNSYGFEGNWAFRGAYAGGETFGMSESALMELYRDADVFLNVTGAQEVRDEHLVCPRRIYVESDPVRSQVLVAQGDAATIDQLRRHDCHFSFGENLGAADCKVPVEQFTWLPTRQPIVTDFWTNSAGTAAAPYTTIATWQNRGKDVTLDGEVYSWSKDVEFRRIIDLPKRASVKFELAMTVAPDIEAYLTAQGWALRDSVELSLDPDTYRSFIQGSRGEMTVAKDQNVRLRSGWFSDRSACYLAAGRPVITQSTAFENHLPTGRGLFGFQTTEDVLTAVDAVESDYSAHSLAATAIAHEYFDAEKVLASMMGRAGL